MSYSNKFFVNKIQIKQAVESCLRGEKAGYYKLLWWHWDAYHWGKMLNQCLAEMEEQFQVLLAKEDVNASCLKIMALLASWGLSDEEIGLALEDISSIEKILKPSIEKGHAPSCVVQAIVYIYRDLIKEEATHKDKEEDTRKDKEEDTHKECSQNLLQRAWKKKFAPAILYLTADDGNEKSQRAMLIEAAQDGFVPAMYGLAQCYGCWFYKLYGVGDEPELQLRNWLEAELRHLTWDPILIAAVSTTSKSLWKTLMIREMSTFHENNISNLDFKALEELVGTLYGLAEFTWRKLAAEHRDAGAACRVFDHYINKLNLTEAAFWLQRLYCMKAVDNTDFALKLWEECTPEAFDEMLTKYRPSQIYLPYADNDDFSYSDYFEVIKKHPFITNIFFVEIKDMNFITYPSAPPMYSDIMQELNFFLADNRTKQWKEPLTEATKKAAVRSSNYSPTVWKNFTDDMQKKPKVEEDESSILLLEETPQPRSRSSSH